MSRLPLVSIVIPTLNEEKYLPVLLASLAKIDAPLEIIIVDGDSSDATTAVAHACRPLLKHTHTLHIHTLKERGIARQRNVGAKLAASDILLFCDADIVAPSTKAYIDLINQFIDHNHVVAGSRIVPIEKSFVYNQIHACAYYSQHLLLLTRRPFFGGAFLLTKRDIFNSVNGFDESLRISEDVDYSQRAGKLGSFALFRTPVAVSTRRFQKYGFSWILKNPLLIVKLVIWGKLTNRDKVFYPFGEY